MTKEATPREGWDGNHVWAICRRVGLTTKLIAKTTSKEPRTVQRYLANDVFPTQAWRRKLARLVLDMKHPNQGRLFMRDFGIASKGTLAKAVRR